MLSNSFHSIQVHSLVKVKKCLSTLQTNNFYIHFLFKLHQVLGSCGFQWCVFSKKCPNLQLTFSVLIWFTQIFARPINRTRQCIGFFKVALDEILKICSIVDCSETKLYVVTGSIKTCKSCHSLRISRIGLSSTKFCRGSMAA